MRETTAFSYEPLLHESQINSYDVVLVDDARIVIDAYYLEFELHKYRFRTDGRRELPVRHKWVTSDNPGHEIPCESTRQIHLRVA